MWQNFKIFEQEYSDPSRFKSRNYSSLFEERERKRYSSELPKLEASILRQIRLIEETKSRTVSVYGFRIMDYLKEQKETYNAAKEEQRKERQNKKDQESTTASRVNSPLNRVKGLILTSSKVSPAKRLQSTTSCLLVPKNKLEFKNSTCIVKNNQEFKRSQVSANFTPVLAKKRTSIKSLNEKFKRRSKHLYQVKEIPPRGKLLTKLEAHNEMNSSESGIYAGASSSSSNQMDEEFDEFKDNDFICSTLLLDN